VSQCHLETRFYISKELVFSSTFIPFHLPATVTQWYLTVLTYLLPMALQFRGKYQLLSSAHNDSITCVAFSIKGDYIAFGGLERKLQIFSLADGELHYSIITPSPIKSLIWLPGAEQTLVCACHSGILINMVVRPGVRNRLSPMHSKPGHSRIPY
jgi:WD40 repeat protein